MSRSLRAKFARDAELASSAPPAVEPAGGGGAFAFGARRTVELLALGAPAQAVLVERLGDLDGAVRTLEAEAARGAGAAGGAGESCLDGEFDTVYQPASGKNKQREARAPRGRGSGSWGRA